AVDLTGVDVGGFGLDAEHVLGVLLVGDADVDILAQVGHGGAGFLTGPQLAAVVQIAADLDAVGLGGLAGFAADVHDIGAQRRRDAGEVEPVHTLKDGVPVEIGGGSLLDGGVRAVIDAHRAALRSALLVVVDADTVAEIGRASCRERGWNSGGGGGDERKKARGAAGGGEGGR